MCLDGFPWVPYKLRVSSHLEISYVIQDVHFAPHWESQDHLFLECPYSLQVWSSLVHMVHTQLVQYDSIVHLMESMLQGVDLQSSGIATLCKLIFEPFIWHIWRERCMNFQKF